jgi:multicopper oxidase
MANLQRRAVLGAGLGLAGGGLLDGCARSRSGHPVSAPGADPASAARAAAGAGTDAGGWVSPDGPEVAAAEKRRGSGPLRKVSLFATPSVVDLGGRTFRTWTYGGELPGPEIRLVAGEVLEADVTNHLPQPTTVHWHGIAIRNDMDGVPDITQRAVAPGGRFTYRFAAKHPGTYWFHPHVGVQLDRGLHGPLIVEDPREPLAYDQEWIVVLDDWVDGVNGSTPDAILTDLNGGRPDAMEEGLGNGSGGMDGMNMRGMDGRGRTDRSGRTGGSGSGPDRRLVRGHSELLRGHPGDVAYPYYLINGRPTNDPQTFNAKPGDRIRMRIINAGGDTAFRVALGGHRMTVTHADGRPVVHATTDALLLGMGERYDVLVTAGDGAFPLVALAEGKGGVARAVLRTAPGSAPDEDARPGELDGRLVTERELRADASVALSAREPDTVVPLHLSLGEGPYEWGFNGRPYDSSDRNPVHAGQRVGLSITNGTGMWHPIHLHGHSFARPGGSAVKDTVIVLPGQRVDVELEADNPGLWMLHCHNIYHAEAGMMTLLGYRT